MRLSDSGNAPLLITHGGPLHSAEYSPDATRIITAGADKTVQIWDASSGQRITALREHSDEVMAATYSQNGRLIATASKDKLALLWDARTYQLIASWAPRRAGLACRVQPGWREPGHRRHGRHRTDLGSALGASC